jgi:hypothetical protein
MRCVAFQCGIAPSEIDRMSLADWSNMNAAVDRKDAGPKRSKAEIEAAEQRLMAMDFAEMLRREDAARRGQKIH